MLKNLLTRDISGVTKYFDKPVLEKTFTMKTGNTLVMELLANAVFYGIRKEQSDDKKSWNYDFELPHNEAVFVTLVADMERFGILVPKMSMAVSRCI